mmetsp:Transcript_42296/g.114118  ORF Transcript_42296/g.114118 Transcript_42296/m.114118 type:complete len:93 (+) Transcript_42296:335-613(+)
MGGVSGAHVSSPSRGSGSSGGHQSELLSRGAGAAALRRLARRLRARGVVRILALITSTTSSSSSLVKLWTCVAVGEPLKATARERRLMREVA